MTHLRLVRVLENPDGFMKMKSLMSQISGKEMKRLLERERGGGKKKKECKMINTMLNGRDDF